MLFIRLVYLYTTAMVLVVYKYMLNEPIVDTLHNRYILLHFITFYYTGCGGHRFSRYPHSSASAGVRILKIFIVCLCLQICCLWRGVKIDIYGCVYFTCLFVFTIRLGPKFLLRISLQNASSHPILQVSNDISISYLCLLDVMNWENIEVVIKSVLNTLETLWSYSHFLLRVVVFPTHSCRRA